MGRMDMESGIGQDDQAAIKRLQGSNKQVFIMKTLGCVGLQLLATTFIVAACYTSTSFREMTSTSSLAVLVSMTVIGIIAMLAMFAMTSYGRVALIPFTIFTICMAILVAIGCLTYSVEIIIQSAAITAVATAVCIGYIWVTKRDLHSLHGILSCGLMILIIWGIVISIFQPSDKIQILYSIMGIIIFVGYILIDTSDLVAGRYNEDEYLIAAMGLYLDIINLFLYVLSLLDKCLCKK
jgi:FtsH-binding integral membrane protein